jgi:hypothetical protein
MQQVCYQYAEAKLQGKGHWQIEGCRRVRTDAQLGSSQTAGWSSVVAALTDAAALTPRGERFEANSIHHEENLR